MNKKVGRPNVNGEKVFAETVQRQLVAKTARSIRLFFDNMQAGSINSMK